MSTGYWVSDNCLDIFESIEGLKPETAKLFFFFRVFFLSFFAGDAVEYLYRLGVSGRLPALDSSYRRVFVEF